MLCVLLSYIPEIVTVSLLKLQHHVQREKKILALKSLRNKKAQRRKAWSIYFKNYVEEKGIAIFYMETLFACIY